MDGIAERIKDGSVLLRNGRIQLPNIRLRNYHVLRERSVRIHTDDLYVLADVGFAGAALQALAAGHVHLGRNEVTFFHASDFISASNYFTAELVPRNQRRTDASLRPAVPFIDMQISAADGSDFDLYQDVITAELRDLYFANFRSRRGTGFHDRLHRLWHPTPSRRANRFLHCREGCVLAPLRVSLGTKGFTCKAP